MCLAIPAKIIHLMLENRALVEISGITKDIALSLLSEPVTTGDFVIVHVGFVLTKLSQAEADKTLALLRQLGELE
jgi:hydrogenase expression/formation protein HypC